MTIILILALWLFGPMAIFAWIGFVRHMREKGGVEVHADHAFEKSLRREAIIGHVERAQ